MQRRLAALLPALLALVATLPLLSCAVEGDFANPPTLYVDEMVNRAWQPEIYVEPRNPPMQPLTAVLFPLKIRQQYSNAGPLSEEMTRVLWNVWLKKRVFPGLAFARGETWRGPEQAVAKAGGADLIVGGDITNLMFGGASGTTDVSLRLEIYDAATGTLLWSMAHAGQMRGAQTGDFVLVTKKSRLPAEPVQAIMEALASDMAAPVQRWNNGQPEEDEKTASPMQ